MFTRVIQRSDFNLIEEEKMKGRLICVVALAVVVALPVFGQRGQEHGQERGPNPPRANQGRVPPPPQRRDNPHTKPEPERHETGPDGRGRTSGPCSHHGLRGTAHWGVLMNSLHTSLGFSPDWQRDNSVQTGTGWSGGFDHLFAVDPRSAPRKFAMKPAKWDGPYNRD